MFKKSPTKPVIPTSSKSKKSVGKEREKKKILPEPSGSGSSSSSSEKLQLNILFENETQYTGFGPETVQIIAEQFLNEQISENICVTLAEDITYKVREILQAAAINMRQGKRKYLQVGDVNATFKKFNIEKIYGPSLPNWMTFGDPNNLSCVPEQPINLVDLATSESQFTEPGDIGIDYKWLKDTSLFNQLLVNNSLNNYSEKIMNAAVSNKKALRTLALKDVAKNVNIGPVIQHLCNFCFLILQKNVTYSNLAIPTLHLLEAIMFNPCTCYSVEEKQVTLLIYLLLENIMNATNDMLDEVTPICRTLGRLCLQWTRGAQIVVDKINKYLLPEEPVRRLSAPVISALTYIGNEPLNALLWPHIAAMFKCVHEMDTGDKMAVFCAILKAASVMYRQTHWDFDADCLLREEFGDCLVPLWSWGEIHPGGNSKGAEEEEEALQSDWLNMKKSLLKTLKVHSQQQVSHRVSQFKLLFRKAKLPVINPNRNILITGYKTLPIKRKTKNYQEALFRPATNLDDTVNIVTGRRTLFALKKTFSVNNKKCNKNVRDILYMML